MGSRTRQLGALGLLVLAGCSQTEEYREVVRERRKATEEVTEILSKIGNEKDLAEAKDALNERFNRFERIARKARALPHPPPPEVIKQLEADASDLKEASEKMSDQVRRVRRLPGAEEFFEQFEGAASLLPPSRE